MREGMNDECALAGRHGRAHRHHPLPISIIFFHATPHKQNNHLRAIHPNGTKHPHTIHPNETVGAVPACPPERSRSGVSIIKIHALCAGDERRMRPCRATRAGTQAPPLPISVIFFHTIPYKQNNHLHTIHPNGIKHPHAIPQTTSTVCAQFTQTKP